MNMKGTIFEMRQQVYSVFVLRDHKKKGLSVLLERRPYKGVPYFGLPADILRHSETPEQLSWFIVQPYIYAPQFRIEVSPPVFTHPNSDKELRWGKGQGLATFHLVYIEAKEAEVIPGRDNQWFPIEGIEKCSEPLDVTVECMLETKILERIVESRREQSCVAA